MNGTHRDSDRFSVVDADTAMITAVTVKAAFSSACSDGSNSRLSAARASLVLSEGLDKAQSEADDTHHADANAVPQIRDSRAVT